MMKPEDATGWPIHEGSRVRVHPDRGLKAYTGTVLRIFQVVSTLEDGDQLRTTTVQVHRDKRAFNHIVSPEVCTVLRQAPRKTLPIQMESIKDYKNPFPSDEEEK